jgi:glycosidase
MQRLPIGMKLSTYEKRFPTGGKVGQARICPTNWWVGMKNPNLQLLIYDQDIHKCSVKITYPGVSVVKVHPGENPNYLFVDLRISPATKPGKFTITLCGAQKTYTYELLARKPLPNRGLSSADNMYLIMPDRFANGDPSNDSFKDMNSDLVNRDKIFFRHGGDIQGIIDRLDYLKEMGITAIWIMPLLESDQPYESYHGYAPTDHYQMDKRYGSNELYKELVEKAHAKGMKVVMDIILNHMGDQHWTIRDIPFKDWINQEWDSYTSSNYRDAVLIDPYASETDRNRLAKGWFDNHMPDLNQHNPFLANYLLYSNLWWMEYSGHDAYRIDTYFYPEQEFVNRWGKRMQEEYPGYTFFGETWVQSPVSQALFTAGNRVAKEKLYLPAVTDFQMNFALMEAANGKQGWTDGVNRLYLTLGYDFLYQDARRNVTFLDNHDMSRLLSSLGNDWKKFHAALTALITVRGIPCLYYGTEIGITGAGGMFGEAGRRDFTGGWKEDKVNKFSSTGREPQEEATYQLLHKLLNYRKQTPALQLGQTRHFIPENGVYVFFRYDKTKRVMVVWNTSDKPVEHKLARYAEMLNGYRTGLDVLSGQSLGLESLQLEATTVRVIELMK